MTVGIKNIPLNALQEVQSEYLESNHKWKDVMDRQTKNSVKVSNLKRRLLDLSKGSSVTSLAEQIVAGEKMESNVRGEMAELEDELREAEALIPAYEEAVLKVRKAMGHAESRIGERTRYLLHEAANKDLEGVLAEFKPNLSDLVVLLVMTGADVRQVIDSLVLDALPEAKEQVNEAIEKMRKSK